MNAEKIFFQKVKEDRGWFFVEYQPPHEKLRFAMLQLVIPGKHEKKEIAQAMETELQHWLNRYPIPLMVSAFDGKGELIKLEPFKKCSHLIGFVPPGQHKVSSKWGVMKDEELPSLALDRSFLKTVYSNIPFKTSEDIQKEMQKNRISMRIGWWIVFLWAVGIPVAVLILGEASVWFARAALAYGFWKALVETLKLMGKWKKSSRELEKEKEELDMKHHHYHCKKNPTAFLRLRNENFEQEERERIQQEAKP